MRENFTRSTNYYSTFIEVAEDCPVTKAEIPKGRGDNKTVPELQFEMIVDHPYKYTQDEILFEVFALRHGIDKKDEHERNKFFSKGQACLRSSSLGKRYGWGIHFNEQGKAALYAIESKEYRRLASDKKLQHFKAMRTSRDVKPRSKSG